MEFDNGYYSLVAQHSGKAMALAGGGTTNGAWIIQWGWNGGDEQLFALERLPDGYYTIRPKLMRSSVVAIGSGSTNHGAATVLWPWNGGNEQKFVLVQEAGCYSLRAAHSGQALCIGASSQADGARVIQWPYGGGREQLWRILQMQSDTLEIWSVPTLGLPDHADHTWVRCPQAYDNPDTRARSGFGCWQPTAADDHLDSRDAVKVAEAAGPAAYAVANAIRGPVWTFGKLWPDTACVGIYGVNGVCHQSANLFLAAAGTNPIVEKNARPRGLWFSYMMYGPYGTFLPGDSFSKFLFFPVWAAAVLHPARARLMKSEAVFLADVAAPSVQASLMQSRDEVLAQGVATPEELQARQFAALAGVAGLNCPSQFTDDHRRLLAEKNELLRRDWNGNPNIGEAMANRLNDIGIEMQKQFAGYARPSFDMMSGDAPESQSSPRYVRLIDPRIAHDGSRVTVSGSDLSAPASQGRLAVVPTSTRNKAVIVIHADGRLAQVHDTDRWHIGYPAELAGRPELRFQAAAVVPTSAPKKSILALTGDGRLAQIYDTDRWHLDFPAELAGKPELRFQSVAATPTIPGKKSILALTTDGRLAHVHDTDRWNLDFPAEAAGRSDLRFKAVAVMATASVHKTIIALTSDGRMAQIYNLNGWRLEFPAEAAPGGAELRYQTVAVAPTSPTTKAIVALTTDGRLAHVHDTDRWNLDFPAESAGRPELRFQAAAVVPTTSPQRAILALTTDGRLTQMCDSDRWNLDFPAESAGRPELRFQSLAAMPAASAKKEIFLLTPSKRLAHVYDTDRWNLDFPAELALR